MNYELNFKELKGTDIACFNACINGFRANSFINFSMHFEEDLSNFFSKVSLTNKDKDNEEIELNIGFKKLNVSLVEEIFNKVLEHRKKELAFLFKEKEIEFDDLDELDKLRYSLLFNYGNKLGGYAVICTLSVEETIKIGKFFKELEAKKIETIKQYNKNK